MPARPDNFTRPPTTLAEPGTYNPDKSFGSNAKSFKISTSPTREPKIQTAQHVGPGVYDVSRAIDATKPRIIEVKIDPLPY